MSHHAFNKVLQSSSVTGSCHGHFIDKAEGNLLVAKHDVLELYSTTPGVEHSGMLRLEGVFTMTAGIRGLEAVRFPGREVDSLVLAFADAKLSVLQWDRASHAFETVALHLLEEPGMLADKTAADAQAGSIILRADPGGPGRAPQCLVVVVFQRYLFVLPFATSTSWDASGAVLPAPYPLEPQTLIDLHDTEHNLLFVRDIAFTSGSYMPTLMVLHELEPSWSGRLTLSLGDRAQRTEKKCLTNALSLVSLHVSGGRVDTTKDTIATKVPYNAFRLMPISAPPFGALILCPNVIMHISKDERSGYAVHLNEYGRAELSSAAGLLMPFTEADLRDRSGRAVSLHEQPNDPSSKKIRLVVSLEGAQVCELPDHDVHCMLALANGEVCLLHIGRNKQNGNVASMFLQVCEGVSTLSCVPKLHSNLASCPRPSSLTAFGRHVFVGSRTGDSAVLKKDPSPSLLFTRMLTLLNTGPIVDLTLGDSSVQPADEPTPGGEQPEHFPAPSLGMSSIVPVNLKPTTERSFAERHETMELVAATGRGRDGAICILNRSVKPLVMCEHKLDASGCWSFYFKEGGTSESRKRKLGEDATIGGDSSKHHHDYVCVSTTRGALVLKAGSTLAQTTETPLLRDPTVHVANLLDRAVVLQVTASEVLAAHVGGDVQKTHVGAAAAGGGPTVHQAASCDRHGVLLMTDGTLRKVSVGFAAVPEAEAADEGVEPAAPRLDLEVTTPELQASAEHGFVTSIALYQTDSHDSVLYAQPVDVKNVLSKPDPSTAAPRTVLTVAWTSGTVQLLDMDTLEVLTTFHGVPRLPEVLATEAAFAAPRWRADEAAGGVAKGLPSDVHIVSAWVGRVDSQDRCVHLVVLLSDETTCYYAGFQHKAALRFKKLKEEVGRRAETGVNFSTLPRLADPTAEYSLVPQVSATGDVVSIFAATPQQPVVTHFERIFGNSGLFIRNNGKGCQWAFSERGMLRVHDMYKKVEVINGMTPLDAPCCPQGFVFCGSESLKVLLLTWHKRMNFKAPWPTRKILLRKTPHKVLFDGNLRTYTIAVSESAPFRPVKTDFDKETDWFIRDMSGAALAEEEKAVPASEGIPVPTNPRCELLLYSSFSWKPFVSVPLKENERVLALEGVTLRRMDPQARQNFARNRRDREEIMEQDRDGDRNESVHLQAVGTGFPIAEDVPCRGRLLILRVRVGRTREDRVLEVDCELATKGPVTAITSAGGYIFASVAAKIHVYSYDWNAKRLDLVSWCDAKVYTSSLCSMRDFVLSTDIFQSASLYVWSEIGLSLSPVAKDLNLVPASAAEFTANQGSLCYATADDNGNISVLHYDPQSSALSLETVADAHIDTTTQKMLKLRTFLPPQTGDRVEVQQGTKTAILFGTKHGGVCSLQPIAEHTHRDLHWVFSKMVTGITHFAGLHPKASRKYKGKRLKYPDSKDRRSVLADLSVLEVFRSLSRATQDELCKASGAGSREQVLAMLESVLQETRYL